MTAVYHFSQLPLFPSKECTLCHVEKSLDEFYKSPPSRGTTNTHQSWCKTCWNERRRQKRLKNLQTPPTPPETKICIRCGIEKPFSAFYKDNQSDSGIRSACKDCLEDARSLKRHGRVRKPRHFNPNPHERKFCPVCHAEKELKEFPRDRTKKSGYASRCKICANKKTLYHHWAHRERELTRMRAYYASKHQRVKRSKYPYPVPASSFSKSAYNHAYNLVNRDRILAQKREYGKANRIRYREIHMRRKARKKGAVVGKANYQRILEHNGNFCYICEKAILPYQKMHFDHVIPLARGGKHTEDNIKPTHAICNERKGTKLLSEMMPFHRCGPIA